MHAGLQHRASAPFRIDLSTTPAQRLRLLDALLDEAMAEPSVRALADLARARAGGARARPRDLARWCLALAQAAGYRPDPPGEWYQAPWYTVEHGGDCEDLAVLVVALLRLSGIVARLVWIDQPEADLNHVSAEAWLDADDDLRWDWRWTEPSVCGARLGEEPRDAVERTGRWDVFTQWGGAASASCTAPQ